MTRKQQTALSAIDALSQKYPDAKCSLEYKTPFQLLVATRLSAQCTDARVNLVTPALFERFPTAEAMATATEDEVAELIKSCGLYRSKAKDLVKMAQELVSLYGGELPDTLDGLTSLSGVGRKTANLIMGDVYGKPAVVADTHCIRISYRLGLTSVLNPKDVELQLKKLLPPDESNAFCHRLVLHGRDTCTARSQKCDNCCMADFCPKKDFSKIKSKGKNK